MFYCNGKFWCKYNAFNQQLHLLQPSGIWTLMAVEVWLLSIIAWKCLVPLMKTKMCDRTVHDIVVKVMSQSEDLTQSQLKLFWGFVLKNIISYFFQNSLSFCVTKKLTLYNKKHAQRRSCIFTDQPQLPCLCQLRWGAAHVCSEGLKHSCSYEMNTILSCGCLISGVSHRRHRNRVNANEMWWKVSPRVAQAEHTSSDYCTINHPCVNASAFILRTPIRHRTCAARVINLGLEKEHRRASCGNNTHSDSQRSQATSRKTMFCRLCFSGSGSISIFRYSWGVQIYSIKPGLLRKQSDHFNDE